MLNIKEYKPRQHLLLARISVYVWTTNHSPTLIESDRPTPTFLVLKRRDLRGGSPRGGRRFWMRKSSSHGASSASGSFSCSSSQAPPLLSEVSSPSTSEFSLRSSILFLPPTFVVTKRFLRLARESSTSEPTCGPPGTVRGVVGVEPRGLIVSKNRSISVCALFPRIPMRLLPSQLPLPRTSTIEGSDDSRDCCGFVGGLVGCGTLAL
jgi:hypothetical protein